MWLQSVSRRFAFMTSDKIKNGFIEEVSFGGKVLEATHTLTRRRWS